ncbi:MAG: hypothetical protein V7750_07010 [Sneathiella sp.]
MAKLIEIMWSLFGCYRLALKDKNALTYFNLSEKGFWGSFTAILIALPILGIQHGLEYKLTGTDVSLFGFVGLFLGATVIAWSLYLTIVGIVTKLLKVSQKFALFVIIYNWAQLALMLAWLPVFVLTFGLMGPEATQMVGLLFIGASYVFLWYVLVRTLEIPGPVAAALTFLEFVISIIAQQITLNILLS